jgi:hypothetical protein
MHRWQVKSGRKRETVAVPFHVKCGRALQLGVTGTIEAGLTAVLLNFKLSPADRDSQLMAPVLGTPGARPASSRLPLPVARAESERELLRIGARSFCEDNIDRARYRLAS